MDKKAEKAMSDAAHAKTDDAGKTGGSEPTSFDDLIKDNAVEPGVSEQPEAEETASEAEESTEEESTEEESTEEESTEEESEETLTDEERAQLKKTTTERIEKKIGKAHAKQKQAEERASAAEQEREELAGRVAELETRLEAVDVNAAAAASGVSELFLIENEAALEKRGDELTAYVDALDGWIDENEPGEIMTLEDGKEFTYAEVKAKRRHFNRMVERELPRARKILSQRAKANDTARKLYPDLFKSTTAAHQEMQTLLRTVPGLRAQPDARLLIGRMIEGRKLEKKAATVKAVAKPKPTAPKPPDTGSPAARATGREALKHDPNRVRETGSWDDLV